MNETSVAPFPPMTPTVTSILGVLVAIPEPTSRTGTEISREIGTLSNGSLYPALRSLVASGLVYEAKETAPPSTRMARSYFSLTERGREAAQHLLETQRRESAPTEYETRVNTVIAESRQLVSGRGSFDKLAESLRQLDICKSRLGL